MSFQANYFDGLSAKHTLVLVRVAEHAKHINFDVNNDTLSFNLSEIELQAKLGNAKRLIDLPNGGRLEATDISELEAAIPSNTSAFWRSLHYLENHLGWVMVALVATIFAGWLFLQFGVPKLAEYVAKVTPPAMETKIGEQALQGLDSQLGYFSPSETSAERKASIAAALNQLCSALGNSAAKSCPQYRLEFRDGGVIGANAFALPGGIMVVTDQLIMLAQNDTEIVAVLAHELGHVKQRHAFRQTLQGVLSGLILAAITGDVSSIGSGLPAALMQMKYSREHETEADFFALNALLTACLPPKAFADILQRLQDQAMNDGDVKDTEQKDKQKGKQNSDKTAKKPNEKADKQKKHNTDSPTDPVSEMLASHPDTQARIKPFLAAKQNCN
jgi:Zn-dependent protease with chaperone function